MRTLQYVLVSLLSGLADAQFPPRPEGVKWLESKFHKNVTISYKEPGICETTLGVKSYAGHVHLPPGLVDHGTGEVQNYTINTFFWFFESRKDSENSPLAIWLNGGPGSSSLLGLLEENGPCRVANDSETTYLNPWSWNNEVNMLYLDQPNQAGFSYDVATNGTWVLDEEGSIKVVPADFTKGLPEVNLTSRYGTFASQEFSHTANSTVIAAHALWHFLQIWFFEFPHYKSADDRISLWTESYGGHYGPGFMNHFQEQNEKIANGSSEEQGAHYLHLDTLGIINGMVDMLVQGDSFFQWPYNNTYGIEAFNKSIHDELMLNWTQPRGCKDRMAECQAGFEAGGDTNLTEVCAGVETACFWDTVALYGAAGGRADFDIAHPANDPFPPPHLRGYLTSAPVLAALGVPVNYTAKAAVVGPGFLGSYDGVRSLLGETARLLDQGGVKVHMAYGDRDFMCNWVGGERASLAVPHAMADEFAAAGYEPLMTPPDTAPHPNWLGDDDQENVHSGFTRQLGNFSFTRVFQSGHEIPAYQPAAAYAIFMRATFNRDIATGQRNVTDDLATVGPADTWDFKNVPPPCPEPRCYVLNPGTCTPEVWDEVMAGKVVVEDYFVVDILSD